MLRSRAVSRPLPLSNPSRSKLRDLDVCRTLRDGDTFLSLAQCLSRVEHVEQGHKESPEVFVDPSQIAYTSISVSQQQRQCTVSSIACEEHPNEPVRFFCRTCEGKCICAECAVSGQHQGHHVTNADAAWQETLSKIDGEYSPSIERAEGDTENARSLLLDRRTEWAAALHEDKQLLSLTNQQLKKYLAAKQDEVLRTMSLFIRDFGAECEGFRAFIHKKINIIEARAQMVADGKGSLDPQMVLDFASREYQSTQDLINSNLPRQFVHLPKSRAASLDHLQQVTQDLLAELSLLRNKIQTAT